MMNRDVGSARMSGVAGRVPEKLLDLCRARGATAAEVYLEQGRMLDVFYRQGSLERLTQAELKGVGLRVLLDGRLALASSTDFSPAMLEELAERAVALAREAGPDEGNDFPRPESAGEDPPSEELGIYDPGLGEIPLEEKLGMVKELEQEALSADELIVSSEGAGYSEISTRARVVNTLGVRREWDQSSCSIYAVPVAEKNGEKHDGYYFSAARSYRELRPAGEVAREAARRAVALLGGRQIPTQEIPVVFDALEGGEFLGGLLGALNGLSVHLDRSFLAGRLGEKIGSSALTITDDGTIPGAAGTAPFDDEGVGTRRKVLVEGGVLRSYLYDTYAARKAGRSSTGNGLRSSYADAPAVGPTNFFLQTGDVAPEDLWRDLDRGLLVLGIMGGGLNAVTGDYSSGAEGIWIEEGELKGPVARVTIAATAGDLLHRVDAVADNLNTGRRVAAPSFRVSSMMVSGI